IAKNLNRVAVALTHLLAVGTWHHGDIGKNLSFRNYEDLSVKVVEFDCDVPRHLDMLLLIAADRNNIGAKRQDCPRQQDGITKYSVLDLSEVTPRQSRFFVFVAMTAFQQTHRGDSRQ